MSKKQHKSNGAISAYVNAVKFDKDTPAIIDFNGNEYRIVNGRIISQKEFTERYPIPYLWEGKGFSNNADKTKNYHIDKKAY